MPVISGALTTGMAFPFLVDHLAYLGTDLFKKFQYQLYFGAGDAESREVFEQDLFTELPQNAVYAMVETEKERRKCKDEDQKFVPYAVHRYYSRAKHRETKNAFA